MTRADRARLATAVRQRAAEQRAAALQRLVREGECLKRAAWQVGVSYRTAKRYRRGHVQC